VTIALQAEELYGEWSDETVLPVIEFLLNNTENEVTGKKPFELHFGSKAATYHSLPSSLSEESRADAAEFLKRLNFNLETLHAQVGSAREKVQQDSLRANKVPQTCYQPGDLVFYNAQDLEALRNKNQHARWLGPYTVKLQEDNNVQCEELFGDKTHVFHVSSLKLFAGTRKQAEKLVRWDTKQSGLRAIYTHYGDQHRRMDMRFVVEFDNGECLIKWFDHDLQQSEHFQQYCSRPDQLYLEALRYSGAELKAYTERIADATYPAWVKPGAACYINLVAWNPGTRWYDKLQLPGQFDPNNQTFDKTKPFPSFWYKANIEKATTKVKFSEFDVRIHLFARKEQLMGAPAEWLYKYVLPDLPAHGVLVDAKFAKTHPQVLNG